MIVIFLCSPLFLPYFAPVAAAGTPGMSIGVVLMPDSWSPGVDGGVIEPDPPTELGAEAPSS